MGEASMNRCSRRWLWAVSLALLLAFPAGASATSRIWVSPRGSDAGLGTKGSPFATLGRAQKAVRQSLRLQPNADVAVILRGGTYRMKAPLKLAGGDSGRHGHDVVYRAYWGEHPLVSGAMRVPGSAWSPFGKGTGIWRARVGKVRSREFYVNGQRASRASTGEYPAGFLPSWNGGGLESGIEYLPSIEPGGLNPASWGDPTKWTNVGDIEAVILTQWKTMSVPLRSVTPAAGSTPGLLHMVEPAWRTPTSSSAPMASRGFRAFGRSPASKTRCSSSTRRGSGTWTKRTAGSTTCPTHGKTCGPPTSSCPSSKA
jgi:hypothetical protein